MKFLNESVMEEVPSEDEGLWQGAEDHVSTKAFMYMLAWSAGVLLS